MIGKEAGKSFAYVLGVFLGDGCVTWDAFRLNTIDEDFAAAVRLALGELTHRAVNVCCYPVKKSSKPNYGLTCKDADLGAILLRDTQSKRVIPSYVWEWPIELQKQFIIGLMDSEGFVAKLKRPPGKLQTGRAYYMGFKSCDLWVRDLALLMERVGLRLGKIAVCPPNKPGYKTPVRFHIKMQSWVNSGMRFNIKRKQERVDEWASTKPLRDYSKTNPRDYMLNAPAMA